MRWRGEIKLKESKQLHFLLSSEQPNTHKPAQRDKTLHCKPSPLGRGIKLSFQETEFFNSSSSIKEKHSCVSFSLLFPPGLPQELLPALCQSKCLHSWVGSRTGRSWERTLPAQQKNCGSFRNFGEVSQPTDAQTHFPAEPEGEWAPLQCRSGND